MKTTHIGQLAVSKMGYGAMALEGYYGAATDQEAAAVLSQAVTDGITLIDTADAYGAGHNERLVATALESTSHTKVAVATKVGIVYEPTHSGHTITTGWGNELTLNTSPDYVRWAVEQSLERLNVATIDLLYLHYIDPVTPIEQTMEALAALVAAGKITEIGLSNMTADQLRRAHAVHPIAAVQYEYSLQNRKAEAEVLPLSQELGATFVAWSPLGSGLLASNLDDLDAADFRQLRIERGQAYQRAQDSLHQLRAIAAELGSTPAQLALAWLYHKADNIVAIPSTRKPARIKENLASLDIILSADQVARLDELSADNAFGFKQLM